MEPQETQTDNLSTATLFHQACQAEGETCSDLLARLHRRASRDDIAWFVAKAAAADPDEQSIALDVLAQVGYDAWLEPAQLEKIHTAILPHLAAKDTGLLQAALYAAGWRAIPSALETIAALSSHSHADIREAAAFALEFYAGPLAESALIALCSDPDSSVREGALLSLCQESRPTTPQLLAALKARTDDVDPAVAEAASEGLRLRTV